MPIIGADISESIGVMFIPAPPPVIEGPGGFVGPAGGGSYDSYVVQAKWDPASVLRRPGVSPQWYTDPPTTVRHSASRNRKPSRFRR